MAPDPEMTRERWRRSTRRYRARMTSDERRRHWREARRAHRAKVGNAALVPLVDALPETEIDRLLAALDPAPVAAHD